MEEKSISREIIEEIEKEIERIPGLLDSDSCEFLDRHAMMQTYLLFRMLEEIEGIHNGFYVLYNEKKSSQGQASESKNAMELIDWRLGGIKETVQVLGRQLDELLRQPAPGKDAQFWMQKLSREKTGGN